MGSLLYSWTRWAARHFLCGAGKHSWPGWEQADGAMVRSPYCKRCHAYNSNPRYDNPKPVRSWQSLPDVDPPKR